METYIINKREYKEVDRDAREGDKVVSRVDFIGGRTYEDSIVEVDYVQIDSENHVVNFQDGKGLWCFTSKDDYCVVEPTNKPISHEQEILFLEEELNKALRYIDEVEEKVDGQQLEIDKLFKLVKPIQNIKKLFLE